MTGRRPATRPRRAQVFPLLFAAITLILIVAAFTWNFLGFETAARSMTWSALRAAGLSALRDIDPDRLVGGRWYVDPVAADTLARDVLTYAMLGFGESGTAERFYDGETDLATVLARDTLDGTRAGVDIEVIQAPYDSGEPSERWFNGEQDTDPSMLECRSGGEVGAWSMFTGLCHTRTAVVVRAILDINQVGVGTARQSEIVAVIAGTDVS